MIKIKVLGIVDAKDSGACLIQDGKILCAINEERLTRVKLDSVFPKKSIEKIFKETKIKPSEIDRIIVAGIVSPFFPARMFNRIKEMEDEVLDLYEKNIKSLFSDFIKFKLKISLSKPDSLFGRTQKSFLEKIIRRDLPDKLKTKPIDFIDHHLAHAASAYFSSGKNRILCVTADGYGDGVSLTINKCKNGGIERLFEIDAYNSFGLFYSLITVYLGFKQHRHEGKITGLAAYGDGKKIRLTYPFKVINGKVKYIGKFGFEGLDWIKKLLKNHKKEDIAAWLQKNTEKHICEIIHDWVKKTGIYDIVLAGGVFANVKLNQRIHEIPGVNNVYIFPHMGDGGLAVGAALYISKPKPYKLKHVYFGPEYSEEYILKILKNNNLDYKYYKKIEDEIAKLLSKGKVIGRFNGKMEFGPRALGNRSILSQATDSRVVDLLNQKLNRTEFMPFAPSTLIEHANKCYKNIHGAEYTGRFMTITFECTEWMKKHCPAVVHVDGTARPHLVDKKSNPSYYKIMDEYRKITGIPTILNTSFNMHGEPIVCSPKDAIRTFLKAELDYLAIANFLVKPRLISL